MRGRDLAVRGRRLAVAAALCLAAGSLGAEEPADPSLAILYAQATFDAAVFQVSHQSADLQAITEFPATVVTWTRHVPTEEQIRRFAYPRHAFRPGEDALTDQVWVTRVPQVQELCRRFDPAKLRLALQQLLGMPPAPPEHAPDIFVTMRVLDRDGLFRPCTDPCPGTRGPCSETFPEGVPAEHVEWMARQALSSWQVPGGYPWTRLGYTYNWNPGASLFGASEFVVKKGARVEVTAITPTAEYCAP
jgi:hypothetical protein